MEKIIANSNILSKNAGAIGKMKQLQVPITLTTVGGLSSALGAVKGACDRLRSGKFDAIVMPETPSVISVGELCMGNGYNFYWGRGKRRISSCPMI